MGERQPQSTTENQAEQLQAELSRGMETKESRENLATLHEIGERMYEEFKGPEYSARDVLTSIADAFNAKKRDFDPKMTFMAYIRSFGPGLVKLCQQKLVDEGDYDLGKYGEKNDGVDGVLGKRTNGELRRFFQKIYLEKHGGQAPVDARRETTTTPTVEAKVETAPRRPARSPRLKVSSKAALEREVLDYYQSTDNSYRTRDLPRFFGETREQIEPQITNIDPVTKEPFTFMECPIADPRKPGAKGLRVETMMMLKIVEEKLDQRGVKWKPKAGAIGGYEFRGMKVHGKETSTLSSHAFGIAIDIDPAQNGPIKDENDEYKLNRGDIPDQVVGAFVESGFAWGLVGDQEDYPEFGNDAMHFQQRCPADSPEMQAIIQASKTGRDYWAAIQRLEGGQTA